MRSVSVMTGMWLAMISTSASGQSGVRDLPPTFLPGGSAATVSITISPPGGVAAVGLEDKPPTGWTISNISHSGAIDSQTGKIKWGPFFSGSIPSMATYDVQPPASNPGPACFAGTVSFDGLDQPITGDTCVTAAPAVSTWGVLCLLLCLLIGGTIVAGERSMATVQV